MCYITIISDKGFKAELQGQGQGQVIQGFALILTLLAPNSTHHSYSNRQIPGREREKMLDILYCPMFLNTPAVSQTGSKYVMMLWFSGVKLQGHIKVRLRSFQIGINT